MPSVQFDIEVQDEGAQGRQMPTRQEMAVFGDNVKKAVGYLRPRDVLASVVGFQPALNSTTSRQRTLDSEDERSVLVGTAIRLSSSASGLRRRQRVAVESRFGHVTMTFRAEEAA